MSASETAPIASNLHNSIEQLIAQTVKQSQSTHEAEKQKLTIALQSAFNEIETSQLALARAAAVLREALGTDTHAPIADPAIAAPRIEATVEPVPATIEESAPDVAADDRGPHELDVIAHGASIGHASELQSWLRGRPEVSSAQTREFVNGELRLQLSLASRLDMSALGTWLNEHKGQKISSTDTVIELQFADRV